MKKLVYLIVLIVAFGLIIAGCIPVVPPSEQSNIGNLTKGTTINVPVDYSTIQAAITAASPGDTILVAAGTYNENVTIDESVILQGGSGVTLQGSGSGSGFLIKSADITIDEFEIKNFAIGIRTYGGYSNFGNLTISNVNIQKNTQNGVLIVYDIFGTVTIEDCQITENSQNGIGISNAATIGTLQISNTQVSQNGGHGLFLASTSITNLLITDSSFDGSQTNGFCGITFGTTASNIGVLSMTRGSLSGNKGGGLYVIQAPSQFKSIFLNGVDIYNNQESGIMLGGNALTGALTVENCILQGNGWEHLDLSGGWFQKFSVTGNTFITGNTFNPGPWCALYIGNLGGFGGEVAVHKNDFVSGKWGIGSDNSVSVDATCNWWGADNGPGVIGSGNGDKVYGNVDYNPWITKGSTLVYSAAPQPTTFVVLEATLSDSTSTGISGMDVDFYLSGNLVGNATTGSDGVARYNLNQYPVGVYEVYALTICSLNSLTEYLAVYDPSAGFVTGGGWINSPAGASTQYPLAEGKASFGFVSKYQKGQSTPTGNTEFQFKAGNLNFHSDSYDWLVIAGPKAMYKGTGTINGSGTYGFMLSAIDGQVNGGGSVDKFRIKIWDKGTDTIIYDNQIDDDDNADPTTAISGGQIVIHKVK